MKKHQFKPVNSQINLSVMEEQVIKYWKQNKTFEKSVEFRPENKTWTFLDGPPFITGLPHYGTLLSSIPKDLYPRYMTMKGYRVRRVWGWDCHGLPAENKVENKLKITRKKDIEEKIGVGVFIKECKNYVSQVSSEWEWYVDHIARWVDFKNAYRTMDTPYMESVMWVFKQMYEKDLIYKGLRVSLYCPHCVTPISNFEVAMDADNYKEITENAAVFKYQMQNDPHTFILAWSTTPWNKLATPALAVNPNLTYVKVKQRGNFYILAKTTTKVLTDKYEIVEEFKGKKLIGQKFVPHYNFYKIDEGKRAFVIIGGDFVAADEGTGVVTIAAYGEEDLAVMQKENIQIVLHVDEEGMLKKEVSQFAGMYYLKADKFVIQDLKKRNLIYHEDLVTHTVPMCWRCHTRLFYAPQNAWYVNVGKLKPKMEKTNKNVNWFPKHFKLGRYLKSLQSAPDWCISRSRYWGSPVPVWECECGHRFVPGSIKELEEKAGVKITDLHKPGIDEIKIKCDECKKTTTRVKEVLDSWIEAGSASFAERHFPFNQEVKLAEFFPPDFIVEYTGQIRAWFYVLHVIATALYDSPAFKNVMVTGVILGTDGRKMSKNYGNYPDPQEMLTKYGGDALRLYLLGSPVMRGEDILISETEYRNQVRGFLLILWNVYNFFISNAIVDNWQPENNIDVKELTNVLDKWILSRLSQIQLIVEKSLDEYNSPLMVATVWDFVIKDVSTWYVRRIRDRVGPTVANNPDKTAAYQTLFIVLTTFSKILAPLVPFITEEMYRNLTGEESVHLCNWPKANKEMIDTKLETDMQTARKIVELAHSQRKEANIKVRIPLAKLTVVIQEQLPTSIELVVKSEINVKQLEYKKGMELKVKLDTKITPQLQMEGDARGLIRKIQVLRKEKRCKIDERIIVTLPNEYKKLTEELINLIKSETLAKDILWKDTLEISTGQLLSSH